MNNWKILTIETSGRIGNLAVGVGPQVIESKCFSGALRHSSELMPTVADLCQHQKWLPADLNALFVSCGPGSFTGIRIAVTLAKTLAFATDLKIVAVPSLEAQTLNANDALPTDQLAQFHIAPVLEAGRGMVFSAVYRPNPQWQPDTANGSFAPGFDLILPESAIKPADLIQQAPKPFALLGEGIRYHPKDFDNQPGVSLLDSQYAPPRAEYVHACGWQRALANQFANPDQLVPNYLRRPEAIEKWEELHGK